MRWNLCSNLILLFLVMTNVSAQPESSDALVLDQIPAVSKKVFEQLSPYQQVRSAVFADWLSNQGGILIQTRFGETAQIHHVAQPASFRRQLTFFEEPVHSVQMNPNPEKSGFLFLKDIGGSEAYQIYFQDWNTGAVTLRTDGLSRNGGMIWSQNGDQFVFSTTQRNGIDTDIYLAFFDSALPSVPLIEEGGYWGVQDWSPDGQQLLVLRYVSINESYPYLFDIATKTLQPLFPETKASYRQLLYAKNSEGLYFTSDQDHEFVHLYSYSLKTKQVKDLTPHLVADVEQMALSFDGKWLAFTVNQQGKSEIALLALDSGEMRILHEFPSGQIQQIQFHPQALRLAVTLETPQIPGDVFEWDLSASLLKRWTFSELGGLDANQFSIPTLITYPTFDQVDGEARKIPAWYYQPKGTGPFPVLIQIHGGPEGQSRLGFNATIEFLVQELGIAVLVPNVRGSSGYGKSYLLLDNGKKREDSVKDIGALLDWIETRPELEAKRVAVMGGSYGGYMVLASLIHYGDRLCAGIDSVGISNFVTFLQNTKGYRQDLRRVEYGDERDPEMREFLMRISPTTRASEIKKPLLIAQGLNDPRVPVTESEQMVQEIRKRGGQVWYFLAKNEGHGFRKKFNRNYFYAVVASFLEQHLLAQVTKTEKE